MGPVLRQAHKRRHGDQLAALALGRLFVLLFIQFGISQLGPRVSQTRTCLFASKLFVVVMVVFIGVGFSGHPGRLRGFYGPMA